MAQALSAAHNRMSDPMFTQSPNPFPQSPPTPRALAAPEPAIDVRTLPLETRVGEIRAWRTWDLCPVRPDLDLISPYQKLRWPPQATMRAQSPDRHVEAQVLLLRAGAPAATRRALAHDLYRAAPPASPFSFDHGLYAHKDRDTLFGQEASNHIYGEVVLWGEVVEHEHGYRAEFMRVWQIHGAMPLGPSQIIAIARAHGIDLDQILPRLRARYDHPASRDPQRKTPPPARDAAATRPPRDPRS